jgi:uncharacterized protein YrzB (UPF0473 family)
MVGEDNEIIELSILEETRVGGVDYYLVTDAEDPDEENDEEINAFIVKDVSDDDAADALMEFVEDDEEFDSISRIFDELMDELD